MVTLDFGHHCGYDIDGVSVVGQSIAVNYQMIQEDIQQACERSGRSASDVALIAVTKYVSLTAAETAVQQGVRHIGESREQGFSQKWEGLQQGISWHFIGSLQSRKVKHIIDKVDYIHSLDRLSLAKEIQKRSDKPVNCFLQVNVSGEATKHGLASNDVLPFIKSLAAYPNVRVVGLMTMAPHEEDAEQTRPVFRRLRQLRDDIQSASLSHAPCTELSMGMSNDYVIAIEEGATFIRIGTRLVGHA